MVWHVEILSKQLLPIGFADEYNVTYINIVIMIIINVLWGMCRLCCAKSMFVFAENCENSLTNCSFAPF